MKIKQIIFGLVAMALCSACSKEGDTPEPIPPLSHDERPVDWVVDKSKWDPSFSMTITVEAQLPSFDNFEVTDDDLMAAFMCGSCRCSQPPVQSGKKQLFFLNAIGFTTDDPDADKTIVIKYYSAKLQHIFTATAEVPFVNGEKKGTPSAPYHPTWKR